MQKLFCGWDAFRKKLGFFILYEHNEEVVMDIFKMKMEYLFGMFFFPCMILLFCDYEKKVGIKLILYVCS